MKMILRNPLNLGNKQRCKSFVGGNRQSLLTENFAKSDCFSRGRKFSQWTNTINRLNVASEFKLRQR